MPIITIEQISERVTAWQENQVVTSTGAALRLREGERQAVTYFPAVNTLAAQHHPAALRTHCPYKGEAAYFDVGSVKEAAWVYYDPLPDIAAIAGYIAYMPDQIELAQSKLVVPSAEALSILDFWFEEVPPKKHFVQDDALDAAIKDRFLGLYDQAAARQLAGWAEHPCGALALILLLDQFSRNLFRGKAKAFDQDEYARQIANKMVEQGDDLFLPAAQRAFVYLPFMHSERLSDQNRCVSLFASRLPGSSSMSFALSHRADIHRYGRFPYRDTALGR